MKQLKTQGRGHNMDLFRTFHGLKMEDTCTHLQRKTPTFTRHRRKTRDRRAHEIETGVSHSTSHIEDGDGDCANRQPYRDTCGRT